MAKRTVESTKRRLKNRIERLEQKQKRLIDKIVYSQLSENNQFFFKMRIRNISRTIQTYKNCISFETRQSRGNKK